MLASPSAYCTITFQKKFKFLVWVKKKAPITFSDTEAHNLNENWRLSGDARQNFESQETCLLVPLSRKRHMGFQFFLGESFAPSPASRTDNLPEKPRTATKKTALATV